MLVRTQNPLFPSWFYSVVVLLGWRGEPNHPADGPGRIQSWSASWNAAVPVATYHNHDWCPLACGWGQRSHLVSCSRTRPATVTLMFVAVVTAGSSRSPCGESLQTPLSLKILSFLSSPTSTECWRFSHPDKMKNLTQCSKRKSLESLCLISWVKHGEWTCGMSPGLFRWFGWMSQALFPLNYWRHCWWNIVVFWWKAVNPPISCGISSILMLSESVPFNLFHKINFEYHLLNKHKCSTLQQLNAVIS